MPYNTRQQLPKGVKEHLPSHAQEIYKEAFNNAYQQYRDPKKRKQGGSREETAHQVAWGAVKHKYHKGRDGDWHRNAS